MNRCRPLGPAFREALFGADVSLRLSLAHSGELLFILGPDLGQLGERAGAGE